jgi:hypothetical protein
MGTSPKPARQRFVNGSSRAFGAGSTPRRRGQPLGRLPQAARRARHAGACKSTDTVAKRRGCPNHLRVRPGPGWISGIPDVRSRHQLVKGDNLLSAHPGDHSPPASRKHPASRFPIGQVSGRSQMKRSASAWRKRFMTGDLVLALGAMLTSILSVRKNAGRRKGGSTDDR